MGFQTALFYWIDGQKGIYTRGKWPVEHIEGDIGGAVVV